MLQILREFSADPILINYVIDDVWEYMKAMKVIQNKDFEFYPGIGDKNRGCK